MTILSTCVANGFGQIPATGAADTPPVTTFQDMIEALDTVGIWPMSNTSNLTFTDLVGTANGTWVIGIPGTRRPPLVDGDDDGGSVELIAERGSIPYDASHVGHAGGGFIVIFQTRDAALKQALVNRAAGPTAGRVLMEITEAGQLAASIRDASAVKHDLAGGTIVKGTVHGAAFTWGAAGAKLYLDSATPVDTNATTDVAAGISSISVGAWHADNSGPFDGLMAWLVLLSSQPSDSEIGDILAECKVSVSWANADDAGEVVAEATADVDVLANDHFAGTAAAATVTVTVQGSLGTWAVQGDNSIRYTAGETGGSDTAGRYTVNGSAAAVLSATVTPPPAGTGWAVDELIALPTGYGTWQTVWQEDTAGITQAVIDANQNTLKNGVYPWRRYSMDSPDSRPAFRDRFAYPQQLEPIGWDSPHITTGGLSDLANARYLLLRWHYWCTDDWGEEGKWMILCGGRGWIGNSYSQSDTSQYGTDGFGINSMHPRASGDSANQPGGETRIGGLGSHSAQSSAFGQNLSRDGVRPVPGAWRVFDHIVDMGTSATATDGAYRILYNGTDVARLTNIRPAQVSAANCKGIWMRVRPMSGGTPANLTQGHNPGDHFYGGFSMHWVSR